jgi:hypothetical protein
VSNYYVKCFKQYDRFCKRVHFFSKKYTYDDVMAIILGEVGKDIVTGFKKGYKGFIVARPLPIAIIGRTLLATYPTAKGRRNYPGVNNHIVHFFGVELSVKSLEYQEQDTILAACATVALWSSLHRLHEMFQTPIRTPATITRQANEVVYSSRPIPSHGLNVQQINNAILRNDLVAEITPVTSATPLISLLYGYIKLGLPVILGIEIENIGLHAVTLVGYSLDQKKPKPEINGSNEIPYFANRIDKFYAHDDQIVPFSRMFVKRSLEKGEGIFFDGLWDGDHDERLKLTPTVVIVPVYHKIRITFGDVQKWLYRLNFLPSLCQELSNLLDPQEIEGLQQLMDSKVLEEITTLMDPEEAEWDLYLTTTTALKSDMRKNPPSNPEDFKTTVLEQHPRFIWRALLKNNETVLMELLADATDIPRSLPFYQIIWHNQELKKAFKQILSNLFARRFLNTPLTKPFVEFLKTH